MMFRLPESLFGRLISALLLAVGLTVLVVFLLIARERQELLFQRSETARIVDLVASEVKRIDALGDSERETELERLSSSGLRLTTSNSSTESQFRDRQDPGAAAAALERHLSDELDEAFSVAVTFPSRSRRVIDVIPVAADEADAVTPVLTEDTDQDFEYSGWSRFRRALRSGEFGGLDRRNPQLDIVITKGERAPVHFRVPVPREEPPLPTGIFVQLGLLTLVLGGALYVVARTITNPLSDLARAADALGGGARYLPLKESGAREIRETTRAFNMMQERLGRFLDSRTRIVSAMSHDLRTPLTRLKLRVEQLDDPQLQERFNADLDEMSNMVEGSLHALRGVSEHETFEQTDLNKLLAEIQSEFAEAGNRVQISGKVNSLLVTRPYALKRCLNNLVLNAIKYGISASVAVSETRDEFIITVSDKGPGLPDDLLDRVFEPYYRVEESRSQATGGVGLGLSIARDIAQAHGGTLTLRNLDPQGLEARLRLPRNRSL